MTTADARRTTGKAARILAAAETLIRAHGFKGVTMSAIAQRAHVGKGTPYLYWRAKEDLFIELITGTLAGILDRLATRIHAEPGLAHAERLCPAIADAWLGQPLVRALQISDADVLGALIDDPRSRRILTENGATALLRRLLPIWSSHGTISTEWGHEEQAAALEMMLSGYFAVQIRGATLSTDIDPAPVLQRAISSMLQARKENAQDGEALAKEISGALSAHAQRLRESMR